MSNNGGYRPTDIGPHGDTRVRTSMFCHSCNSTFIAELDFAINGTHVAVCPRCKHEHFRVIKDGQITEERWPEGTKLIYVEQQRIWPTSDVLHIEGATPAAHIRDRWLHDAWLNRSDSNL